MQVFGSTPGCGRRNSGSNLGTLPHIVHKVKRTRDGERDPGNKKSSLKLVCESRYYKTRLFDTGHVLEADKFLVADIPVATEPATTLPTLHYQIHTLKVRYTHYCTLPDTHTQGEIHTLVHYQIHTLKVRYTHYTTRYTHSR